MKQKKFCRKERKLVQEKSKFKKFIISLMKNVFLFVCWGVVKYTIINEKEVIIKNRGKIVRKIEVSIIYNFIEIDLINIRKWKVF